MAGLVQRCVIIQRDKNGFGLTVSGDNPVFVQLVKEGKAERDGNKHYYNTFMEATSLTLLDVLLQMELQCELVSKPEIGSLRWVSWISLSQFQC